MTRPIQPNTASTVFGDNNTFIAGVIALGNVAGRDLTITINDNPYDVSAFLVLVIRLSKRTPRGASDERW